MAYRTREQINACAKRWYHKNRDKARSANRKWRQSHKEQRALYMRNLRQELKNDPVWRKEESLRRIKWTYGLEITVFNQMLAEQQGRCCGCGKSNNLLTQACG